jgi:hypothetical protein
MNLAIRGLEADEHRSLGYEEFAVWMGKDLA